MNKQAHLKAVLRGEKRYLTILFADIANSTKILAATDIEDSTEELHEILSVAISAIHQFGGFVSRTEGDGFQALFGAPAVDEAHAAAACRAAIELHERVLEKYKDDVRYRIGINTGKVVMTGVHNDLGTTLDVNGPAVVLARRMQEVAQPGSTIVTDETNSAAKSAVTFERLNDRKILEFGDAVATYQIMGKGDNSDLGLWSDRNRTELPFVGRDEELAQLNQRAEDAVSGLTSITRIVGDAGIGKTRLIREFLAMRSHNTKQLYINPDFSGIGGQRSSFLASCLGAMNRIELGIDAGSDKATGEIDFVSNRRAVLSEIADVLKSASSQNPLIVVVENLQWFDANVVSDIERLHTLSSGSKIAFIVSDRSADQNGMQLRSEYLLRLSELGGDSTQEILKALFDASSDNRKVQSLLSSFTSGVPLYLNEIIASFLESGTITGSSGKYRFANLDVKLDVPTSLESLLLSRIESLSGEEREALQVMAILGTDIPASIASDVLSALYPNQKEILHRLIHSGHIVPTLGESETTYDFGHALLRETVHSISLRKHRTGIHRLILKVLEKGTKRARELRTISMLSHHAFEAGIPDKAVQYAMQAGLEYLRIAAYSEAVSQLEIASNALRHEKYSGAYEEVKVEIDSNLGRLYPVLGMSKKGKTALENAKAYFVSNDIPIPQDIVHEEIRQTILSGNLSGAESLINETLKRDGDDVFKASLYSQLSQVEFYRGRFEPAIQNADMAIDLMPKDKNDVRYGTSSAICVDAYGFKSMALAFLGSFETASDYSAKAVDLAANVTKNPLDLATAHFCQGFAMTHQGKINEAIPSILLNSELCMDGDLQIIQPWLDGIVAFSYARIGDMVAAAPLYERSLTSSQVQGLVCYQLHSISGLAVGHLMASRYPQALEFALRAHRIAEQLGFAYIEMWEKRVIASAKAQLNHPAAEVIEWFEKAIDMAVEMQMKPDYALTLLGFCRFLIKQENTQRARIELNKARKLIAELQLTFWIDELNSLEAELDDENPKDIDK